MTRKQPEPPCNHYRKLIGTVDRRYSSKGMGSLDVRIYENHETTHIFGADEAPPEVWMHWGGQKRRVRFLPQHVTIKWHRKTPDEWRLAHVWVDGPRIHAKTCAFIGETFYESRCGERREIPDWLTELIDDSNPNPVDQ